MGHKVFLEIIPSSVCENCASPPVGVPKYLSQTERAKVRLGFCGIRKVAVKEVVHKREIDLMAIRNKNIIQFYHHYGNILVMQYAGGPTLAQVTNVIGDMREEVAIQISNGLTYLHSLSVLHKNIRTDNILLTQNFDVKIAGFGSEDMDCSVEWLAPELREDPTRYSRQSDIYNLGVIMEKMGKGSPTYMQWMVQCQSKKPNDRPLDCPFIQAFPEDPKVKECETKEERLHRLKSIALQGDSNVANHLGWMYKTGTKVPINETEALEWFLLAAKDHADAQITMGVHYRDTDPIAAEEWFLKAAEQGYHKAWSNLGRLMFLQRRYGKAKEWYCKAAEFNDAHAQYSLGEMYFQGCHVSQDDLQALEWFLKAAVQGYADAEYSVGHMHQYGRGTRQDDGEAEKWYMKAMEQGHITAEKSLAKMRNDKVFQQWAQETDLPAVSVDVAQYLDTANFSDILKNLKAHSLGPNELFLHATEEREKFIENYSHSLVPVPQEVEEESSDEFEATRVW
ncbi:signal transducing kinase of the PAK [Haplosporangium gracile]|nr:signal transducing kinase of the PAK [Haplosporangium gracile]